MKTKAFFLKWLGLGSVVTVSAAIAQSTFSGIYSGSQSDGDKVVMALTKGGRGLGLSDQSRGIKDSLQPAKTTVTSTGKFKGATASGETIVTGKISSDFKVTGTVSWDDGSSRLTCKRIYK